MKNELEEVKAQQPAALKVGLALGVLLLVCCSWWVLLFKDEDFLFNSEWTVFGLPLISNAIVFWCTTQPTYKAYASKSPGSTGDINIMVLLLSLLFHLTFLVGILILSLFAAGFSDFKL